MARRLPLALGLRAQIVLALCFVFALSFALLGLTAVQLTRRAYEVDRERSAQILARTVAAAVDVTGDRSNAAIGSVTEALLEQLPSSAVVVQRSDGGVYRRGRIPAGKGEQAPLSGGGSVRVWLPPRAGESTTPLINLFLFYVALTGAAVMLFTYVALTYWIVRPIQSVTRSAERLAEGSLEVRVPVGGAAEVMRLAVAFNEMATQLKQEQSALQHRLRELEETTFELQTAQQQLVHGEKLATVGRLAAGVAHEIGNPLSAILGLVELLRGGELQEAERREFLDRIQTETERIHGIIRDLLDFSRRGVDTEELEMTADLRRVVEDAVNLVRPQKELRKVDIAVELPEAIPRVVGPQHRLTQVLLNLILNAADALQGEGDIRIEVQTEGVDDRVLLAVTDNGPGIAPGIIDTLFEPFTTTKPPGKGTGLGLAVSLTLVESLGGSVTATNLEQGGARFEVSLRAAPGSRGRLDSQPG